MTRIPGWWIAGGLLACSSCQSSDPVVLERAWPDQLHALVFFLNGSGQLLTPSPVLVPPSGDRIQVERTWDVEYQTLVHVYSNFVGGAFERRGVTLGGEGEVVRAIPREMLVATGLEADEPGPISLDRIEPSLAPKLDLRFERAESRSTYCGQLGLESRVLDSLDAVPLLAVADRDHYFIRLRESDELDRLAVLRGDGTIEAHSVAGLISPPAHLASDRFGRVYGVAAEGVFEIDVSSGTSTIGPVLGSDLHLSAGVDRSMYTWDRRCSSGICPVRRLSSRGRPTVFNAPDDAQRLDVVSSSRAVALTPNGVLEFNGADFEISFEVEFTEGDWVLGNESNSILYSAAAGLMRRQGAEWSCVPDLDTSEDCHSDRTLDLRTGMRISDGHFAFISSPARLLVVSPEGTCALTIPGDPLSDLDVSLSEGVLVLATRRILSVTRTVIWTLTLPRRR